MKIILASFLLLHGLATIAVAGISYGDNPNAGHYIAIRGFRMYCEIYGQGPPLLMLHGNGGSIANFAKNIPYFAKKYRVIAVDSRAQGKSIDSGATLTFEMMADDDAALLDALHINSACVLGWSDGGNDALLLAMRHPKKVTKLAVTGANISPDASAFSLSSEYWQEEKIQYAASASTSWKTAKEKNDWKLFMLDWTQPHIEPTALHAIRCPSLIICGDHDVISVQHTTIIYKNISQATLWVVPHSGHGTLQEHSGEFNRRVDAFFSQP